MATQIQPIRVVVSALFPAVRAGLRAILDASPTITVVGEFAHPSDHAEIDLGSADVLVAEVTDELLLRELTALTGATAIVFLGTRPGVFQSLAQSAPRPQGMLLQGATGDEIVAAVTAVAAGLVVSDPAVAAAFAESIAAPHPTAGDAPATPLTAREQDVLALVAAGLPNKTIALRLGISEHTVKFHVGAILGKLGAASRTEAVTLAVRGGLLPL